MSRGGKRRGAGGPKHFPPLKKYGVYLTDEQSKFLRRCGRGDLSKGLRWLIDAAIPLVVPLNQCDVLLVDLVGKVDVPRSNE